MTLQVGWIGGKERTVSGIIPVFTSAEKRDEHQKTYDVRNIQGQALIALIYHLRHDFNKTYDFLAATNSLIDWENFRLSHRPLSELVMATMTRATNIDNYGKIPAVTYREVGNLRLITSTTGSATECARLLGCPQIKGDTEDIADWVVKKGLENLPETLQQIAQVPCDINMVSTLFNQAADEVNVYLLRSRPKTEPATPFLAYSHTESGLIYASLPEDANSLMQSEYRTLPEESVIPLVVFRNKG